jgi:cystathionine beta-lyase/cystathionine gamma-synthase
MKAFESLSIHAGEEADLETGALRQPINMSTTFKLPRFGIKLFDAIYMESMRPPFAYTRWCNPTLRALEDRLMALEQAPAAVVFASGMAAISGLVFTNLNSGDHMVASEVCYAGTMELFGEHLPRFGIEVDLVDTSDLNQLEAAIRPNTKLVFVETPANPILRISDIQKIAEMTHKTDAVLAVDSTWASPALQNPLLLGSDFVIHSLTKFINGHGDALGGVILGSEDGIKKIRKDMLVHLGGALSPFNAWLINRGLVTLSLRMGKQSENALRIAKFLEGHRNVSRVFYPGLESHPQHGLAEQQMKDYGGMLTFQLKRGLGAAIDLSEKIKIFQYATSLGHAHSLLFYYPTDLYIDSVPYLENDQKAGIREWMGEGIMRASIGLENPDELIADLDQALSGRTYKGVFGPAAYGIMKRMGKRETGKQGEVRPKKRLQDDDE